MTWFKVLGKLTATCFVLGLALLIGFFFYFKDELPDEATIRDVRFQIPMKVYTKSGELISQFGEKKRIPVAFNDIPQDLIDAIIATEDARFYEHFGVDPIGVFRAAFVSLTKGHKAQGASTITMQLARNVFLSLDKTWVRKVKELYIALHLEQLLTKREILTLYLNKIYFGNRAYGIGAAAQVYYGKDIDQLTLPQLAMIAGLPKAPSRFNPIRNSEKALWRRNVVLSRMLAVGKIDQSIYEQAKSTPITASLHGAQIDVKAPYVAEQVRKLMVEKYGKEDAYSLGLNVYTTINSHHQQVAEKAVVDNLHSYDERHGYKGPSDYLWDLTSTEETSSQAWETEDILTFLENKKNYADLIPAVVTNITDNRLYALLKNGQYAVIEWHHLSWARAYISDKQQGPEPKTTADIVQPGALIWLRMGDDGLYRLSQIPEVSGAFISMDPNNGHITALIGGYSFQHKQYNRIYQARRQIGSNIKPFIYSAAIDNGFTLASLINDAPINKWDKRLGSAWRPKNSPPRYDGPSRVRRGLAQSKNVMAVRLLREIGVDNAIKHMTQFGFEPSELPKNESLSLGSASLTPLSLITGMSTFANGGYLITPQIIQRVENSQGKVIYRPPSFIANKQLVSDSITTEDEYQLAAPRVINENNAFLISEAMTNTIWGGGSWKHGTGWSGTAWKAQKLKRKDISGKTGTTNKSVDTWFTGFTPKIIATSWTGFDEPNRPLGKTRYNKNLPKDQLYGGESGAKTALPAWIDFMEQILPSIPITYREIPDSIISVRVDRETGLLSRKTDHSTLFEYFIKGTEPDQYTDSVNSKDQSSDINLDVNNTDEGLF